MACHVALHIDRHGEAGDMARMDLDMHGQGRDPSTEALRADSEFIDFQEKLVPQTGIVRIRRRQSDGTK